MFAGLLASALAAVGVQGPAGAVAQSTARVSVSSAGGQSNHWSETPAISGNGRYVGFVSYARNLVPGDTNGTFDVFLHDRETGMTTRVSVSGTGEQANAGSVDPPSISDDGRYVAFTSYASNLVAGDTNGRVDVFLHDRQTGATRRMSVSDAGAEGNDVSAQPSVSADGRFVAFSSLASNLVPRDTNGSSDVFLWNRQAGSLRRVSVSSTWAQGTGPQFNGSSAPSISGDGRYVAFHSGAKNLVAGDTNSTEDVFVRDRETFTTTRISRSSTGLQANEISLYPSISADGRYVAFESQATNLVSGDTNGVYDVFVHDRQSAAVRKMSVTASHGPADGPSSQPSISADGRFVAFQSEASNLGSISDTNGASDVYVRDRQTATTRRASVSSSGTQGRQASVAPAINADGRHVTFESRATNLVPDDTNGRADIFVRDRGPIS